ncbi:hypothetical protein P8631_11195 [Guyparkeria sp. 1SP6A2]|nr:hypothetical protein [Guyparkeria sp. 1SP6A2]
MRARQKVKELEELGRVRLSPSFFMRDFLYSEIAAVYGLRNEPMDAELAIQSCSMLCRELLEPLNATFGRVSIFSGYRSLEVNLAGHENGLRCASNEINAAKHIFDLRDADGCMGATASVVIPWFTDRYQAGEDWRAMAWWIHDHLTYDFLCFFPELAAFNIGWHENPRRVIYQYVEPDGILVEEPGTEQVGGHEAWYEGFPSPQPAPSMPMIRP